jgi:hypothetical protein
LSSVPPVCCKPRPEIIGTYAEGKNRTTQACAGVRVIKVSHEWDRWVDSQEGERRGRGERQRGRERRRMGSE